MYMCVLGIIMVFPADAGVILPADNIVLYYIGVPCGCRGDPIPVGAQ